MKNCPDLFAGGYHLMCSFDELDNIENIKEIVDAFLFC